MRNERFNSIVTDELVGSDSGSAKRFFGDVIGVSSRGVGVARVFGPHWQILESNNQVISVVLIN